MLRQSWTWLLRFSRLLACLMVVTSLWGCATPYEILPSSSGLPTSAQLMADTERLAIPPDLRARLNEVVAKSGALAENGGAHRRFVGQMLNPRAMLQRDLLTAVLEWAGEKPSNERLMLQTRQLQTVPRYEVVQDKSVEEESPSLLEHPKVQFGAGVAAGAAIGTVPLGPYAADVAIHLEVLPTGTYYARVGRTCGEFVSGVGQMIVGCMGMSSGMGISGTGSGAVLGIPLVAASYAIYANGASTASHALHDAGQLWREGPPPDVDPAPQPEIRLLQKSKPAPKPAPAPPAAPAKPVPATQPAKPAAPVETQTKTFDRSTGVTTTTKASGTTTVTKPRVKGKPSGDGAKDVAKGAKRGPKTDPNEPHNATVARERQELEGQGYEIVAGGRTHPEKLIKTEGGLKTGRRPDVIGRKAGEPDRGINVGRTNADGTPVKREQEALDDLNNHSDVRTEFVPYDR